MRLGKNTIKAILAILFLGYIVTYVLLRTPDGISRIDEYVFFTFTYPNKDVSVFYVVTKSLNPDRTDEYEQRLKPDIHLLSYYHHAKYQRKWTIVFLPLEALEFQLIQKQRATSESMKLTIQ